MHPSLDLLAWFFSSHYSYPPEYVRLGRVERANSGHVLFKTRLGAPGWADLGAVLFRADALRAASARFTDCGRWREADGRLIRRLVAEHNASTRVLPEILFLHQ